MHLPPDGGERGTDDRRVQEVEESCDANQGEDELAATCREKRWAGSGGVHRYTSGIGLTGATTFQHRPKAIGSEPGLSVM
jgi:hypothetical protein